MEPVVIEDKEQFEALPESVRAAFVEKDGKFMLPPREDTEGLKSALKKEREARAQYERDLKRYKDIDPEKYAELVQAEQERGDKKLVDEGKIEELVSERIKRAQDEWNKEKSTLSEQLGSANEQLDRMLIDNEIIRQVEAPDSKVRVRQGALEDVLLHARQTLHRDNGAVVAYRDGKPEYGKDGQPMGIKEWLGELATRKPYLFEGSSGAGTSNAGGGTPIQKPYSEWSQDDKDAFIGEHGWQEYEKLVMRERQKKRPSP